MHSTIFQVATEKISEENFISERTFFDGDYSFLDWCADIPKDEQEEVINQLLEDLLPKGMFSRDMTEPRTIIYHGGADIWRQKWVERIHEKANAITTENIMRWNGTAYHLELELTNPLDIGSRFVTTAFESSDAVKSGEFMQMVCSLQPNTKLYIGGIVDFHW